MAYTKAFNLENTDKFGVVSYGGGLAYELIAKDRPGFRSVLLQGDDAEAWHDEYVNMQTAHSTEGTVWYNSTWNECLAELIMDYISEEMV